MHFPPCIVNTSHNISCQWIRFEAWILHDCDLAKRSKAAQRSIEVDSLPSTISFDAILQDAVSRAHGIQGPHKVPQSAQLQDPVVCVNDWVNVTISSVKECMPNHLEGTTPAPPRRIKRKPVPSLSDYQVGPVNMITSMGAAFLDSQTLIGPSQGCPDVPLQVFTRDIASTHKATGPIVTQTQTSIRSKLSPCRTDSETSLDVKRDHEPHTSGKTSQYLGTGSLGNDTQDIGHGLSHRAEETTDKMAEDHDEGHCIEELRKKWGWTEEDLERMVRRPHVPRGKGRIRR